MVKRFAVEPEPGVRKKMERALRTQEKLEIDQITLTPPSPGRTTWRIRARFENQNHELSGGKDIGEAYAAFLEMISRMSYAKYGQQALPESQDIFLADAIRAYIEQNGPKNEWKYKTKIDRKVDFGTLITLADSRKIKCSQVTVALLREYLNNATRTAKRGKHLKGVLKTFLIWGWTSGYFTKDQSEFSEYLNWRAPIDSKYKQAPTRREQSKLYFGTEDSQGGEIPTHDQILQWAVRAQERYTFGELLVHASANLGTRANETFLFTASKDDFLAGKGNFVDCNDWAVRVHWQVSDEPGIQAKPTKNNKRRAVVIPAVENIATGYDLRTHLAERSKMALSEQAEGKNPRALLFPNEKGGVIKLDPFNEKVMRPVFNELGWKMPAYLDASGKEMFMYRFTLHSLRDRFGTTAADEWGYSERMLLEQGSWADPKTVRKFYLGTSDDTFRSVRDHHKKSLLENKE